MAEKMVICTVCPRGCQITVKGEGNKIESIEGFSCKRGEKYATDEFILPKRIITSTVKIENAQEPLLPVRSDDVIPKDSLLDCMKEIRKVNVKAPITLGDVIIENVLGLGCNIVACKSMKEN